MLFNSYEFVFIFLPLAVLGYQILNYFGYNTVMKVFLILISVGFYGFYNKTYVILLIGTILLNYFFSIFNKHLANRFEKKIVLIIGIIFNLFVLLYFKYYNFFVENINVIWKTSFDLHYVIMPLGISYVTFQQISYLVDCYNEKISEYSFLEYCVYVTFFPKISQGPIALANDFLPQLRYKTYYHVNWENISMGLYFFSVGLLKKVVLADTFGKAVTWGWSTNTITSVDAIIVMLSYTFQLYLDFSGYCDMASGIARMFNITLPLNFNAPYRATSVIDFWKRWHITLTKFLREYIYFPLGGSRKGKIRTYINILVIYLISGFWHGANWTFILWGVIHGTASILNRIFQKSWERCWIGLRWGITFIFINLSWIFFRADSVKAAIRMIENIVRFDTLTVSDELKNCFSFIENNAIHSDLAGVIMWIFLIGTLIGVLKIKPCLSKQFSPSLFRMLETVVFFSISVCSMAGVSTFLYFGF